MKRVIQLSLASLAFLAASSAFAFSASMDFDATIEPGQTFNYQLDGLYADTVYNMICTFDINKEGAEDDSAAQITRQDSIAGHSPEFLLAGQRYSVLEMGKVVTFPIRAPGIATELNGVVKGEKFSVKSLDYTDNLIMKCSAYPVG